MTEKTTRDLACEALATAADHVGEMQDILEHRDGMTALVCAYQDAIEHLTMGLRLAIEHIAQEDR